MSMLSEQVKELRSYANVSLYAREGKVRELLREAVDTIESLSAKLAENMEWSEGYYEMRKELAEQHNKAFELISKMPLEGNEVWHGYVSGIMQTLGYLIDSMDKLDRHYSGGWIACEDGNHMPEEHEDFRDIFDPDTLAVVDTEHYTASDLVQVTVYDIDKDEYFVCDDCTVDGKWSNFGSDGFKVMAWQLLPEPYRP